MAKNEGTGFIDKIKSRLVLVVLLVLFLIILYFFYDKISSLINVPKYSSITNQSINAVLILPEGQSLYLNFIQSVLVIAGILSGISVVLVMGLMADKEFKTFITSKINRYTLFTIAILFTATLGFVLPLFSAISSVSAIEYYTFYQWNTQPPFTYLNAQSWVSLCSGQNQSTLVTTSNGSKSSCAAINNMYQQYIKTSHNNVLSNTENPVSYLFYGSLFIIFTMFLYIGFKLNHK